MLVPKKHGEFAQNWTKLSMVMSDITVVFHRTRLLPCLAAPESMATQKLDKVSFVLLEQRSVSCFLAIVCICTGILVYLYICIDVYYTIV